MSEVIFDKDFLLENDQFIVVKDDINFLEHPTWIVSKRDYPDKLRIEKENGFYEVKSTEGLPVRFDKTVLYYLLHRLLRDSNLQSAEIVTTRYEIAKNVLNQHKNFSKAKYDRILLALKRWKAIFIRFEGTFYQGDNQTIKYFSILDYVSLDKKTNKLSIKFNDQYIKQLNETKFYKLVNFSDYKNLTRPVSARLYEILMKNLETGAWSININILAELLTLGKRAYPSQILVAIKPALRDINKKTDLKCKLSYNKNTGACTFRNNADFIIQQIPLVTSDLVSH